MKTSFANKQRERISAPVSVWQEIQIAVVILLQVFVRMV